MSGASSCSHLHLDTIVSLCTHVLGEARRRIAVYEPLSNHVLRKLVVGLSWTTSSRRRKLPPPHFIRGPVASWVVITQGWIPATV